MNLARSEPTVSGLPRLLDLFERVLLLSLYSWLVTRIVSAYANSGDLTTLLLLPSEGLILVFLLLRGAPTRISQSWSDWMVALGATACPMLVVPAVSPALIPPAAGASLMLAGLIIQLYAKLSLGRRISCVPAYRGLVVSGPYRFVRHPMYAGYLVGHGAFLLANPSVWNLLVYSASILLQVTRILAEERLLEADPEYEQYRRKVRHRLVPGLF